MPRGRHSQFSGCNPKGGDGVIRKVNDLICELVQGLGVNPDEPVQHGFQMVNLGTQPVDFFIFDTDDVQQFVKVHILALYHRLPIGQVVTTGQACSGTVEAA